MLAVANPLGEKDKVVDVLRKWRAIRHARENISAGFSDEIDRIDLRPDIGMAKFIFVEDYCGVQVDCTTGDLLHIERRYSDLIENIHDGSYLTAWPGLLTVR